MNNKNKVTPIIIFLSALIMFVSCQKQEAKWKGTIEEVNGVTVVKNPKEPMYGQDVFSMEEELSIGKTKDLKNPYPFALISGIAVDEEGNIYVVDYKEKNVKVFSNNGNLLKTIGREGQGPGEFQRITNIQITPENELMVHDGYASRLTFFSLDGDYLRTVLLKGPMASVVKVNSMGNYLVKTYDFDLEHHRFATEIKVYSSDLAFIRTIAKDKFWSDLPFQPRVASRFLPSDLIICGFRESYEFQILDSEGKTIRKITKDYVPIEISKEEKKKRKITQSRELPRYFPAFQDFSVDAENRLFIQTWERAENEEGYYFDVFDSEGKYIAKVPLKMEPQIWKNNKLYSIEEDEEGSQMVKRYKVTWNY